MGNICGSESKPDPFAQPGRTLASAPAPQATTSRPPASAKAKVGGPPRTLGAGGAAPARGDPRREAAEAAEARARAAAKSTGKLGQQLNAQKAQTRTDTLKLASEEERRLREADAAAQARSYN